MKTRQLYRKIRKELKILIKNKQVGCINEKQRNDAINKARAEINEKYGHTWRNLEFIP
jgi:hypothetical protein